jgi:Zn-dependent protease
MTDIITGIFFFLIIIVSAIIHEYMHGWAAERQGDSTARDAGRLTLNPIPHIDPIGTIFVPLILLLLPGSFLIGWAKPVPYNPFNLKNRRWGPALVAAAGPAVNLFIAIVFGLIIRFLTPSVFTAFLSLIVYINILLAVFNLVPIPPLDGSKILFSLLPDNKVWWQFKVNIERYGMILVLFFILFFWQLIAPIIQGLYQIMVGSYF